MSLGYRVEFSNKAKRNLKKLDKPMRKRMIQAIESLAEDPYGQSNSKKMKGYEGDFFRLRVGTFRVIYEIIEDRLLIMIVRLGPRGDIYK